MPQKNQKKNRKVSLQAFMKSDRAILIICISIAFIFWLLTKMSYAYKRSIYATLNYKLPKGKVLTIAPPSSIEIDVEGTGWDLIGSWFRSNKFIIELDLEGKDAMTLNAMTLKSKLSKQLPAGLHILELHPNFIQLSVEDIASKTIPVVLDNQIELSGLYQYHDSIRISPTFVTVFGPASIISEIKSCQTVPVIMQNVETSFDKELELRKNTMANIRFEPSTVHIQAKVEQVTEKKLELEIEKVGVPDSLLLVLLPKKINVSCIVGLSDYDALDPSAFKAVADFSKVNIYEQPNIRVELRRIPSYVHQVQFHPKLIEYIVRSPSVEVADSSRLK